MASAEKDKKHCTDKSAHQRHRPAQPERLEKIRVADESMRDRLVRMKKILQVIRDVNRILVREEDQDRLLRKVCRSLVATQDHFRHSWILLFDEAGEVSHTAQAGLDESFESMTEQLQRGEFPKCMQRLGEIRGVEVISNPPAICPSCTLAKDYRDCVVMRVGLRHGDRWYGILAASLPPRFPVDEEEQALFSELADDIGLALNRMEIYRKKLRARDALRKSEELTRRILESSNDCIKVVDLEGRLEFMSEGGQALMEVDEIGPFLGKSWIDFWKGSDREAALAAVEQAKQGDVGTFEGYCPTAKGTEKWWEIIITPMLDHDGDAERLLAVSRDITERQRMLESLRESEEKYSTLFKEALDGIVLIDTETGRIVDCNPQFEHLTGRALADLQQLKIWEIRPPDKIQPAQNAFYRLVKKGFSGSSEFEYQKPDGTLVPVEFVAKWVTFQGRAYILSMVRDISARNQAAREKEKLEDQLRQAQKMQAIGTLAGGVAHDFNNLLTIIIGNADLALLDLPPDNPLHKRMDEIRKTGHRAASLTRQLLAFSRKQVIQPQILDLNEVILDMEKMLRRLIGEDIQLVTRTSPDLRLVEADPGHMEQVLMNLSVNARDAMPRGGQLTIETLNVDLDENYGPAHGAEIVPGPHVMLAVSDNGIGMDRETQARIFEPFFTTKEMGHGTGLGLSTVYGIVKQNHGHIWVYSEPGQGSTFKVYFPVTESEAGSSPQAESREEALGGSETVLLVEDDRTLRKLTERMLEKLGYHVLTAVDGDEAVQLSRDHDGPVDLVLTDVVMPGMSGLELADHLQADRPATKILYMSGYTNDMIAHHGLADQDLDLIQKPFSFEDLGRRVRKALAPPADDPGLCLP